MTRRPPGDRSHLERLLNIWSAETGNVTAGRLRNVVGITVIAQMLDGSRSADGKHLFVFKGGAGLQMRYGLRSRATTGLGPGLESSVVLHLLRATPGQCHSSAGRHGN